MTIFLLILGKQLNYNFVTHIQFSLCFLVLVAVIHVTAIEDSRIQHQHIDEPIPSNLLINFSNN